MGGWESGKGYNLNPSQPQAPLMRSDSPHSSHPGHDEEEDFNEPPSKSSRKREMHALQDLGEQLVALSSDRLKKMSLPDALYEAVRAAQGFKMEARRRQMQYVGKLMRKIDPAPIEAQLLVFSGKSAVEVAKMHRLEHLREQLLDDDKAIGAIVELWPQVDVQYLRTLRRNALKERETTKPPKAFREIFRVLRELQDAQDAAAESDVAAQGAQGSEGAEGEDDNVDARA